MNPKECHTQSEEGAKSKLWKHLALGILRSSSGVPRYIEVKSPTGGPKNIKEQGGQGKDKLKITKKQDVFPPVIFQKWHRC